MSKISIKILCVVLIVLALLQIEINNKFAMKHKEINVIKDLNKESSIKYKSLSKLNNEISCLKMCSLIGANNDGDKWKIKVRISGEHEDIINELINLQKYEITSYHISKNNDEQFIVLEMYGIQ
ncbi:MAG: hypothetical protein E7207_08810 [Clostridium butyricum]|nr:hypothetical protein [Clostridium butyricum]